MCFVYNEKTDLSDCIIQLSVKHAMKFLFEMYFHQCSALYKFGKFLSNSKISFDKKSDDILAIFLTIIKSAYNYK